MRNVAAMAAREAQESAIWPRWDPSPEGIERLRDYARRNQSPRWHSVDAMTRRLSDVANSRDDATTEDYLAAFEAGRDPRLGSEEPRTWLEMLCNSYPRLADAADLDDRIRRSSEAAGMLIASLLERCAIEDMEASLRSLKVTRQNARLALEDIRELEDVQCPVGEDVWRGDYSTVRRYVDDWRSRIIQAMSLPESPVSYIQRGAGIQDRRIGRVDAVWEGLFRKGEDIELLALLSRDAGTGKTPPYPATIGYPPAPTRRMKATVRRGIGALIAKYDAMERVFEGALASLRDGRYGEVASGLSAAERIAYVPQRAFLPFMEERRMR